MHGTSSDEAFKSLTVWPQVDAHHPLADRILSPGDGCSKDFRQWGFNIFGLETQELGMLAATVLAETGLPRVFGISMKVCALEVGAAGRGGGGGHACFVFVFRFGGGWGAESQRGSKLTSWLQRRWCSWRES